MHEVSLNRFITDYVSGKSITLTTYEDLRQYLGRLLVEEKGFPIQNISSKYLLSLDLGDVDYDIIVDYVVYLQDKPALLLGFCPGAVSTYVTQFVSLARIFPRGPVPFAVVTDTMDASLIRVQDKKELCRGINCIPTWNQLQSMYASCSDFNFSYKRLNMEKRIAYAMFALSGGCCSQECTTND